MKIVQICMSVLLLLVANSPALADFFKYKDDKGNLIITNRFEDVPKKYRSRVKVVWDKDLTAKDAVARRSAAALERSEQIESEKKKQQQEDEKSKSSKKGKMLVYELDENTGQLIKRFE